MYSLSLPIFLIFLIILVGQKVGAKDEFELNFENFSCNSDDIKKEILQRYNCGLSKNAKRRTINMEFVLAQTLAEHEFHLSIVLPRRSSDFVLLNITTDGCSLLSNKNQVQLVRLIRYMIGRYSNFPTKCPFMQSQMYYLRGFRLDMSQIPAISMETLVQVRFNYQSQQLSLLRGFLTARVLLKSGKNKSGRK